MEQCPETDSFAEILPSLLNLQHVFLCLGNAPVFLSSRHLNTFDILCTVLFVFTVWLQDYKTHNVFEMRLKYVYAKTCVFYNTMQIIVNYCEIIFGQTKQDDY